MPQNPDNFIIWFRDHPSVLADEASPGFVSDIVLADFPWTVEEVAQKWEEFCSDLLSIDNQYVLDWIISPNPTQDFINVSVPSNTISEIEIIDILGETLLSSDVINSNIRIDVTSLKAGVYFIRVINTDGKIQVKKFAKN